MTLKLAGFGCSIDLSQLVEIKQNLDSEDLVIHRLLSQSLKFWQQVDCKMLGILLWKLIQGPSSAYGNASCEQENAVEVFQQNMGAQGRPRFSPDVKCLLVSMLNPISELRPTAFSLLQTIDRILSKQRVFDFDMDPTHFLIQDDVIRSDFKQLNELRSELASRHRELLEYRDLMNQPPSELNDFIPIIHEDESNDQSRISSIEPRFVTCLDSKQATIVS